MEDVKMIAVNVPAIELAVESRGVTVAVDLAKVPPVVLTQLVLHGVKQKVADAASQSALDAWYAVKGENAPKPSRDVMKDFTAGAGAKKVAEYTEAAMVKARDALYEGKWMVREAGGTRTSWTETQGIAIGMAKDALTAVFKRAASAKGVKGTIANFIELSPAVAKYFTEGDRPTWRDEMVMEYIAKRKDAGEEDYIALAEAEVARRAQLVASVDLGDLLGGI